jgi:tripartite-type tricarboxylate transporter receptor subunit TctC
MVDVKETIQEETMSLQTSFMKITAALLCSGIVFAAGGQAGAQVSFKGKTIDVILGSAPGGGTDGTSRLVGTFLEKYLPGNPKMRYRNLPGGHGAKALNYFAKIKPDGLAWAGGSASHTDPGSLRRSVVQYDPTQFHFIGGVSRGGSIVFIRKEKLADLTDPSKPPVVVGMMDGNRSWEQMITWGKEILGWNVRYVIGYPGTGFMMLAVQRGETHMEGTGNLSLLKEMFATGEFVAVSQLGDVQQDGKIEERSNFENVPTFPDLVKGKTSGITQEAFEFWAQLNNIDKWYALPPNTPKAIVDTYRTAWDKMTRDPDFIRQGKSLFSVDFAPISGETQADFVKKTAYPKAEVLAYMSELKVKHGLPAEPLSDEELAALAKEKGLDKADLPAVQVVLQAVGDAGRSIEFTVDGNPRKMGVSSSRTKVSIAGQKADRDQLKAGMNCAIEYMGDAKEANGITCP